MSRSNELIGALRKPLDSHDRSRLVDECIQLFPSHVMARRCGSNLAVVWRSSGNSGPTLACQPPPASDGGLRRKARGTAGNDAALSYIGPDGNQRAEACLCHAPVE